MKSPTLQNHLGKSEIMYSKCFELYSTANGRSNLVNHKYVPTCCLLSAEGMELSKHNMTKGTHTFWGFESNGKSLGLCGV